MDAMCVASNFGKPSFFITMTCNPMWPEIQSNLRPGQTPSDNSDLLARVFKLYLDKLVDDLWLHKILGKAITKIQVIEFQKRGFPHAHILIKVANEDELNTADEIDQLISAEIPDPIALPLLYETVTTCMLHGPCTPGRCIKNGACTKKYPKHFREHTTIGVGGYPQYRRRNNGRTFQK